MKLLHKYHLCFALLFFYLKSIDPSVADIQENNKRNGKFLSMFEIVKFENDVCTTGGNKNGTCFTSQECEDKGGEKDGDCAQGYGVCCVFEVECGERAMQNNTYFKKGSGFSTGNCAIEFCPEEDVCQLRLDFSTFAITGPYGVLTDTTTTDVAFGAAVGENAPTNKKTANMLFSQCNTDSFTVTSASGTNPPVICGTNTGEHMYVDVMGGSCVNLAFAIGGSSASWDVQITTYDKDFINKAPTGCTQYFYGASTAAIKTFNWAGSQHLANQNQRICIRQEKGTSKICYSTATSGMDFELSVGNANGKGVIGYTDTIGAMPCCGYGNMGTGGFDCLVIPEAETEGGVCVGVIATPVCHAGAFCGEQFFAENDKIAADPPTKLSVCSKRVPFEVTFMSDGFEYQGDAAPSEFKAADGTSKGIKGFQLYFIQS